MPFAGIVGDSSENAPNLRIGVVKRLRGDVGGDGDNARSRAQTLRAIITTTANVASRRCHRSFHFCLFHRHFQNPNYLNFPSSVFARFHHYWELGTVNCTGKCVFTLMMGHALTHARKEQQTNLKLALEALELFLFPSLLLIE